MKRILTALGILTAVAAVASFFIREDKAEPAQSSPAPTGGKKKTPRKTPRRQKRPPEKTARRRRQ